MNLKRPAKLIQPVRKGQHRRNADTAAHQKRIVCVFNKLKMIDWRRDKQLAACGKDTVQQARAAPALIFFQHCYLIFVRISRIAA